MSIPNTVPAVWPEVGQSRLAASIRTLGAEHADASGAGVCIVGLPDDTGVSLNHGRPGARSGPSAFRTALARIGGPYDLRRRALLDVPLFDAGDVACVQPEPGELSDPVAALHETHDRITAALREIHERGFIPFCIGGGHDLTYPSVRALSRHLGASVGGINIDAHLDVREDPGSGMPYRSLIESECLDPRRFVEFGISRFASAKLHVEWLESRGGRITSSEDLLGTGESQAAMMHEAFTRAFGEEFQGSGFVSLDLDAIDGASAPGVSAPNPMGIPPAYAAMLAERAGKTESVRHFDIMELNPDFDTDGRTARLSAVLFIHFLAGVSERGA